MSTNKKKRKKKPNTNKFQAVTLQYYIKGDQNKKATSHEMIKTYLSRLS